MVSRNRDRYRKISDPSKAKPVGLPVIKSAAPNSLSCSCGGFTAVHARAKVLGDKAQRHLNKAHGGRGIWL